MKKIALLGSTGSIGKQVLQVVRRYPEKYKIVSLCCGNNARLLGEQIREFKPLVAGLTNPESVFEVGTLPQNAQLFTGEHALEHCVIDEADVVFVSVVGFCGLKAVLEAVNRKKTVALANKEALVAGGELVMPLASKNGVQIIPVDSEHSAIWQALNFNRGASFKRILLTASGGALRNVPISELNAVTPERALKHPNWQMGAKITIDCATMFNKGLEVIEAMHLFNCGLDKIKVLVHPESAIHSMVEFNDNAVIAQIANPSMELPIQLALSFPEREFCGVEPFDFTATPLHFSEVDINRYPCFSLALAAAKEGGCVPCAASGANEQAVKMFLNGQIGYGGIAPRIEKAIAQCERLPVTYENLVLTDYKARECARAFKE